MLLRKLTERYAAEKGIEVTDAQKAKALADPSWPADWFLGSRPAAVLAARLAGDLRGSEGPKYFGDEYLGDQRHRIDQRIAVRDPAVVAGTTVGERQHGGLRVRGRQYAR